MLLIVQKKYFFRRQVFVFLLLYSFSKFHSSIDRTFAKDSRYLIIIVCSKQNLVIKYFLRVSWSKKNTIFEWKCVFVISRNFSFFLCSKTKTEREGSRERTEKVGLRGSKRHNQYTCVLKWAKVKFRAQKILAQIWHDLNYIYFCFSLFCSRIIIVSFLVCLSQPSNIFFRIFAGRRNSKKIMEDRALYKFSASLDLFCF